MHAQSDAILDYLACPKRYLAYYQLLPFIVTVVVVYFILSRLLQLAYSANF